MYGAMAGKYIDLRTKKSISIVTIFKYFNTKYIIVSSIFEMMASSCKDRNMIKFVVSSFVA